MVVAGGMKRCASCGVLKPIEEFAFRQVGRGSRQSWCRACHSARDRTRYQRLAPDARAQRRGRERLRENEVRRLIDEILMTSGCVDCGMRDPIVLEFDHVGPKSANVSDLVRRRVSWERVAREIDACEVRCVNCHKRVTARRACRSGNGTPAVRRTATPGRIELPPAVP